jgi:hypothetical protein
MATHQIRLKAHVGTTYKRALERFHRSRDREISRSFRLLARIGCDDIWSVRPTQGKDRTMRKPRDYDADLKVLADKARQLKTRKQNQLGELVMATGANALGVEELAGALLHAAGANAETREAWRKRGAAFFQRERHGAGRSTCREPGGTAAGDRGAEPAPGKAGAV